MNKDKTQVLLENKEVFEETLNEFSSKPYDLASVNEVIKRSLYNKGSFYYRFKDKYELYISLIDYVFVQQIDIFKKTGFSLITNQNIKSILIAMFSNLIDLYSVDKRYYYVVSRFYNEKDDFIEQSLRASIGSVYERFISKLSNIQGFNKAQKVLVESLYKNLPIDRLISGEIILDEIIEQIIGHNHQEVLINEPSNLNNLIETSLIKPINYLVLDNLDITLEGLWFHLVEEMSCESLIKKGLKSKAHMFRYDFIKIIDKFKDKPIFNHLAIEKLIKDEYFTVIYQDKILRQILESLVFAIIDLREHIIIKDILQYLDDFQRDILFNVILQINGKLSKIILIDCILVFNSQLKTFYYYNDLTSLNEHHFNEFKDNYHMKIHCSYKENGQFHEVFLSKLSDIEKLINSQVDLIKMNTIHEMNVSELREVVDNI